MLKDKEKEMKRCFRYDHKAFTLVEVILSTALVSIVSLIITAFFLNNQAVIKLAQRRQEVLNEANICIKYMSKAIKNSDHVNLINPTDGTSSEIELVRLDIGGGEVGRSRYKLSGTELRYHPTPYSSSNYIVINRAVQVTEKYGAEITNLSFKDGEGESKTEELKLINIELTAKDPEAKTITDIFTQAACRDRIFALEYEWFNGTHDWRYNEADGTLECVDEGYDWVITLEETGVLSPEVMEYLSVEDQDIINLTFVDAVLTDIDGRQVVDGVIIIMSQDSVAIIPPEHTDIDMHQAYGNYDFEVTIAAKIGGYAPTISFGYYVYDSEGERVLHEVVPTEEWTGTFTPPSGEDFGFYMDVGASGYTYYTEADENPDSYDHAWEYVSGALGTLVLGWEDLYGGGDEDHQDFVVSIRPVSVTE